MKKILSFLLSVVFLHSQTAVLYAKHGGPDPLEGDGGDVVIDIVGTYSGILLPTDPDASGTPSTDGTDSIASLGLFSLGMPLTGPGVGSFVIFTNGIQFDGTITAIGDPAKASINGLIEGSYDFSDFLYDPAGNIILDATGSPIIQDYTATIRGVLSARVVAGDTSSSTSNAGVTIFQRIEGTAEMGLIFSGTTDKVLRYIVDGVKQGAAAGTTTDLTGGTGTGTTGT